MRRRLLTLALTAAALIGAACGENSPAIDEPSSVTQGGGDETSTTTTTTALPVVGASTSPVSTPPGGGRGLLRAVRVAGQAGFDRITFEFEGDLPGYEVRYVDPPITEDGSGRTVEIEGDAFLQVRMEPASGVDITGEQVREVYTGSTRIQSDTKVVTEAVRTGDFEALLHWVAGVKGGRAPFKVTTLTGPNRLVIDVVTG